MTLIINVGGRFESKACKDAQERKSLLDAELIVLTYLE